MEFAYNNALSATTSVSSFFANKGYHLNITVHPKYDIAFSQAHGFAIDLDDLQSTLKAEISAHVLCSSSLPCVHARTHHIQHFLRENTAGLCSSHN